MDFISALRERGVPEEIEFDYTFRVAILSSTIKLQTRQPPSQV